MHDVVVAGGGVIGLAIARQAALAGARVLLINHGSGQDAASWAAAGMLSPWGEAHGPDDPLFQFGLRSLNAYEKWIGGVEHDAGCSAEYAQDGLLLAAVSEEAWCSLRKKSEWFCNSGQSAQLLTPGEVFLIEPQLKLPLKGGLLLPSEGRVTPRALVAALHRACSAAGVVMRDGERILQIQSSSGRAQGVRTDKGFVAAEKIVVACGVGSAAIDGLDPKIPVVPRKGQILSLEGGGHPILQRPVRWENAYAVPRPNGELVIGATDEDAGFDRSITPAGVGRLLAAAQQLSPKVGNLPIREIWSGFRPAAPDGLPIIGPSDIEGVIYATGHYRNGILLAPATALAVSQLITGKSLPELSPFSPSRFRAPTFA